ncbi:MAG TPA: helix-turn-helix domain-containing protein [Pyrinomonadaceae bacterium]|jgi:DNA-binding protein Fis|nr:helix-turn-helix domain-containing protein [Pyrinomonadaceae bacterium]
MRAERIGAISASGPSGPSVSPGEPAIDSLRNSEGGRGAESFGGLPAPLKIAERPARSRVQRLVEIAGSLLQETESLARDKAFTEHANRLQGLNLTDGIDFYGEVERFESGLIRLALDQTRGHQARAARLLHIKPTTLNSKIKMYGIEY